MASASSVVEKLPQLPFHVRLNISGRKASVQWKMQSEIGHLFGCALRISYAPPVTLNQRNVTRRISLPKVSDFCQSRDAHRQVNRQDGSRSLLRAVDDLLCVPDRGLVRRFVFLQDVDRLF